MPLILEGLVTTLNPADSPHLAPMGPTVEQGLTQFVLRPYPTSQTYQHLRQRGAGVLHVTDDALLLARAAIGPVVPFPPTRPATAIAGVVLADACRAAEFVVESIDESAERIVMHCRTLALHEIRPFFGFNRAKHAIVEAAILATRLDLLPREVVETELTRLAVPIHKTGGLDELTALEVLSNFVHSYFARSQHTSKQADIP